MGFRGKHSVEFQVNLKSGKLLNKFTILILAALEKSLEGTHLGVEKIVRYVWKVSLPLTFCSQVAIDKME